MRSEDLASRDASVTQTSPLLYDIASLFCNTRVYMDYSTAWLDVSCIYHLRYLKYIDFLVTL